MPNIIEITDFSAPGLDVFVRLTEAQLRSRLEAEKGVFIAESPKVIERALDAGCAPVSLLTARKHIAGQARGVIERCGDIPVYTADDGLLADLTGYRLTRGVLCAFRRPPAAAPEALCAGARRAAVLENIVDSTNIGAIFRSAAALGMDAVLLTPSCCDPLCRRAVRVSMGTVFQVPWAYLGSEAAQWPQPGIRRLRQMGFRTAAMALDERPAAGGRGKAGRHSGHGGRRAGGAHHRGLRLHRAHPHGTRGGLPERGGGQRRGVLAAAGPLGRRAKQRVQKRPGPAGPGLRRILIDICKTLRPRTCPACPRRCTFSASCPCP